MFDEPVSKQATPPGNLPVDEPKDMFAGIEDAPVNVPGGQPNALSAGLLKPKADTTAPMGGAGVTGGVPVNYRTQAPVLGKILLLLLAVAVLGGLGYGGYLAYNKYLANKQAPVVVPPVVNTIPVAPVVAPVVAPYVPVSTATNSVSADMASDKILFGEPIDSDKDGLDDKREIELGTNPNKADTDEDGLTDYEEVITYKINPMDPDTDRDGLGDYDEAMLWKTNPLNPDTDKDGFNDGMEVANGYDPLAKGKKLPSLTAPAPTTTKK